VASRHGEHQLADVLGSEQLEHDIREGADAALRDVFAGDQPALAQPPGELGRGLGVAVGVVGVNIPVIDARAAINST
jgi:hypothetical protein